MLNPEILSPGGQGLSFQNLETFDSPFNLCPLWESRPHPKIRLRPALTLLTVRPAARCLPLRKSSGELTCVATDITCRLASVLVQVLNALVWRHRGHASPMECGSQRQCSPPVCGSFSGGGFSSARAALREPAYQWGNVALYSTGVAETVPAREEAGANWTRERRRREASWDVPAMG